MKKQYLIPQVDTIVLAQAICQHIGDGGSVSPISPSDPAPIRGAAGKLYI